MELRIRVFVLTGLLSFSQGWEFQDGDFKYKIYTKNTLSPNLKNSTGFQTICDVSMRCRFTDNYQITVFLDECISYSLNDPQTKQLLQWTSKHFSIKFDDLGLVENMKVDKSASKHERDFVRAISSAMQVKLDTLSTPGEAHTVTESSLAGECPVEYVVTRAGSLLDITKKTRHDTCKNPSVHVRGFASRSNVQAVLETDKHLVRTTETYVSYLLNDQNKLQLQTSRTTNELKMVAVNRTVPSVVAGITLQLTGPLEEPLHTSNEEDFVDIGMWDESRSPAESPKHTSSPASEIHELTVKVSSALDNMTTSLSLSLFVQLTQRVKELSTDNAAWLAVQRRKLSDDRPWKVLLSAVTCAGTDAALQVLLDWLRLGYTTPEETFAGTRFIHEFQPDYLPRLFSFVRSLDQNTSFDLEKHSVTAFSQLIHKHLNWPWTEAIPESVEASILNIYIPYLMNKTLELSSSTDRRFLLYVRALADIGHMSVVPTLTQLLFTTSPMSAFNRAFIIDSTDKLINNYPDRMRTELWLMIRSDKLETAPRVAAVLRYFNTKPDMMEVRQLLNYADNVKGQQPELAGTVFTIIGEGSADTKHDWRSLYDDLPSEGFSRTIKRKITELKMGKVKLILRQEGFVTSFDEGFGVFLTNYNSRDIDGFTTSFQSSLKVLNVMGLLDTDPRSKVLLNLLFQNDNQQTMHHWEGMSANKLAALVLGYIHSWRTKEDTLTHTEHRLNMVLASGASFSFSHHLATYSKLHASSSTKGGLHISLDPALSILQRSELSVVDHFHADSHSVGSEEMLSVTLPMNIEGSLEVDKFEVTVVPLFRNKAQHLFYYSTFPFIRRVPEQELSLQAGVQPVATLSSPEETRSQFWIPVTMRSSTSKGDSLSLLDHVQTIWDHPFIVKNPAACVLELIMDDDPKLADGLVVRYKKYLKVDKQTLSKETAEGLGTNPVPLMEVFGVSLNLSLTGARAHDIVSDLSVYSSIDHVLVINLTTQAYSGGERVASLCSLGSGKEQQMFWKTNWGRTCGEKNGVSVVLKGSVSERQLVLSHKNLPSVLHDALCLAIQQADNLATRHGVRLDPDCRITS